MEPHQTKRLQSHDCLTNEMLVILQSEVSHLGFDGFFIAEKLCWSLLSLF